MAYLRISDDAMDHPKLSGLSDGAFRFWINANCWCQKHLTDGRIDKGAARTLPRYSTGRVRELITARLWHEHADYFEVHDFLTHNDSRKHVEGRRAYKRRHNDLYSNPDLLRVIKERDGESCRYCGKTVNWHDRRGPFGATYDHIDPAGDNTVENVVVACRGCNSKKRDYRPEEVGLTLRPVGVSGLIEASLEPVHQQLNTRHLTSPHLTGSKEPPNAGETEAAKDALAERAGRFLDRYVELYAKHRYGSFYRVVPARDFHYAEQLVRDYPDDAWLDRLAAIYLLREDRDVSGKSRTVGQFASSAAWCDSELRREGKSPQPAGSAA